MPSTRDLRRRIKSIKNTSQITKAMQMVAASKMRKAQQAALAGRSYATLMNEVLAEVTGREAMPAGGEHSETLDGKQAERLVEAAMVTEVGLTVLCEAPYLHVGFGDR